MNDLFGGNEKGPLRGAADLFDSRDRLRGFSLGRFSLAVAAAMSTGASAGESTGVFATTIMTRVADMALAISGFVCVEVIESMFTVLREGAVIAVAGIEAIVYVAVKAARSVEPGAGADEDAAGKPVRTVVAVRGAVIGSVVEIAVRAYRRCSNLNCDLRGRYHASAGKEAYCYTQQTKSFEDTHLFTSDREANRVGAA
jgi:hypothetical protein